MGYYYYLWFGCTTRTYLQSNIVAVRKILTHLNLEYKEIDTGETGSQLCCGSVLFNTGQIGFAQINKNRVLKLLTAMGINLRAKDDNNNYSLISVCPGCTRTFREQYGLHAYHLVELLARYIKKFRFKSIKSSENDDRIRVSYHDPCHLARHLGIIQAPRDVIKNLPYVEFSELSAYGKYAFCCGSGGGLRAYNRELADQISKLRIMEVMNLPPMQPPAMKTLLTACPFCERSLKIATELLKVELEITDLATFITKFI